MVSTPYPRLRGILTRLVQVAGTQASKPPSGAKTRSHAYDWVARVELVSFP